MKDREKLTLDELKEYLDHHDSIEAGDELLRRLRIAIGSLEDARSDLRYFDDDRADCARDGITEILALVKGTAEAATGGEGTKE